MDPQTIQYIRRIYNDFWDKEPAELESIIKQISDQETAYLDKEMELMNITENINNIFNEINRLQEIEKVKPTPELTFEIERLFAVYDEYVEKEDLIKQDLINAQQGRQELMDIKYVIENYILPGIDPPLNIEKGPTIYEVKKKVQPTVPSKLVSEITPTAPVSDKILLQMIKQNLSNERLYEELHKYSTPDLTETKHVNNEFIKHYEQVQVEKANADMRRGRKPENYNVKVNFLKNNADLKHLMIRMQPIIDRIIKERQQEENKIQKLKNLAQLYPQLKNTIGTTALTEMVKTGEINKDKLEEMKDFLNKKQVFHQE